MPFVPSSFAEFLLRRVLWSSQGIEAYEMEFAARRRFGRLAHRAHRWPPRGGRDLVIECDAGRRILRHRGIPVVGLHETASEVHGIQETIVQHHHA